ncbi:hypothetical protein BST81_06035 [Leptolyngbya sp. 'hensonii']|uniref:SH3 domain-containing protein n=1 Tax=Leptolyngbya sp. 'hensonii' TaxID=1922337 RepID=UPI00094FE069|nr:SH3 domain-containing protein [Leptolyngbya sp. 'hensonii']OLP19314.1 hypothetical protein BST81_06035 [Leptolyngbya sp. 'hensonii']
MGQIQLRQRLTAGTILLAGLTSCSSFPTTISPSTESPPPIASPIASAATTPSSQNPGLTPQQTAKLKPKTTQTAATRVSLQQTSQTLASGLSPIPADVCRKTSFYRVKTAAGSPLRLDGNTANHQVANGTTILLLKGEPTREAKVWVQLANGVEGGLPSLALEQISSGSQFKGKMKVKTLEGGAVNVRSQPVPYDDPATSPVVGTLPAGTEVAILGSKGDWYYGIASNGPRGYIARIFLVCP